MNEHLINPAGIKSYIDLNSNKIKTPGDLICCLPKKYRENFVIAHTSIAGQNSIASSPRVLLFNPIPGAAAGRPDAKLEAIFSINGGDLSLRQANSVEFLHNDSQRWQFSFHDIDMTEHRPRGSPSNPKACMLCHAINATDATSGLRTIFEPQATWTRFVGGLRDTCGAEGKFIQKFEDKALEAILTNPAYRCLDQAGHNDLNDRAQFRQNQTSRLIDLTAALSDMNDREIAKRVRESRDYEIYKFAIVGSLGCTSVNFEPTDWMTSEAIGSNREMTTVDSRIRDSSDLSATYAEIGAEQRQAANLITNYQKSMLSQNSLDPLPEFRISALSRTCDSQSPPSSDEKLAFRSALPRDSIAAKYMVDTHLKSFRGRSNDWAFRYMMESRGVDTAAWEMSPTSDVFMNPHTNVLNYLRSMESPESPLKTLLSPESRIANVTDCKKLAELSKAALTQQSIKGDSRSSRTKAVK